jgi:predicted nucleotidyltransferase
MLVRRIFVALYQDRIPFVLIGGAALTAYGSTRVSLDTDIAIKALDTGRVAELSYRSGLELVVGVDAKQRPIMAETVDKALAFLRDSRQGFMKFLSQEAELDFIYDNPVPFMRLHSMGREVELDGLKVRLACLEHLKIMKELSVRTRDDEDKTRTDRLDLEFIDRKLREAEPE